MRVPKLVALPAGVPSVIPSTTSRPAAATPVVLPTPLLTAEDDGHSGANDGPPRAHSVSAQSYCDSSTPSLVYGVEKFMVFWGVTMYERVLMLYPRCGFVQSPLACVEW